jgi:predicted aconitase
LGADFIARNRSYFDQTARVGVSIVSSCTPYYVGWVPLMGESFVTNESSNTLVSNSVFGAYGNADGIETAVCSAITGRTPKWGMHIKENRCGDVVFHLTTAPKNAYDWDLVGYTVGRKLPPHGKPILLGDFSARPDINMLRQCFSSLASTSAAEICHIVGVTPEARSVEDALGGKPPRAEYTITQQDLDDSLAMLCDKGSGKVELVSIGCPHLSLEELRDLAWRLEGEHVAPGTDFWIWTDYATQIMAKESGYLDLIEGSGARVLNSSCPLVMREKAHACYHGMVMSGAKQAHNIRAQTSSPVYFGDTEQCVRAALTGRWEG